MLILTWLLVATLVQEWVLAVILVHAKALMVTLVVMVSPVVYSGDDTAIGKNSNNHWEMPHLCTASFVGEGKVSVGFTSVASYISDLHHS